jgi:hypothetical protein
MKRIIFVLILCLAGCQTTGQKETTSTVALISLWSGPPEPALTYKIKKKDYVYLTKAVRNKKSNFVFPINEEQRDACLVLAKAAYEEILNTPKISNLVDGVNIRIVLDEEAQNSAVLRNYSQNQYHLKQLQLLLEKLDQIAPVKVWRWP